MWVGGLCDAGVIATMLELSESERIAVGLVTQWELEAPVIAAKVEKREEGLSLGDAWAAFLSGS